jgi:hypothetical protein
VSDRDIVVYQWAKNRSEVVHAVLSTYNGHRLADLRVYVADEDGEPHPTRKGLAIRVEDLPRLRAAVDALIATEERRAAA